MASRPQSVEFLVSLTNQAIETHLIYNKFKYFFSNYFELDTPRAARESAEKTSRFRSKHSKAACSDSQHRTKLPWFSLVCRGLALEKPLAIEIRVV